MSELTAHASGSPDDDVRRRNQPLFYLPDSFERLPVQLSTAPA